MMTDARALAMAARSARAAGQHDLARRLAQDATATAPGDPEIAMLVHDALAAGADHWHLAMLHDDRRTQVYEAAIGRAVRPGDRVLDIGAGSGLLAMMAARAGAAHVYSCEMNPAVAAMAAEIIELNGFADRVTIVPRISTALDVDRDLHGPVDVLVSEILGGSLINEGMLPAVRDAGARLLKRGGRMIPAAGQVVVALGEATRVDERRVDRVAGFDLSPINRLGRRPMQLPNRDIGVTIRGAAVDLYDFDFARPERWPASSTTALLTSDGGRVNCVLLWIRFHLDERGSYESRPGSVATSTWVTSVYPLATPRETVSGETMTIGAWRDDTTVRLWADERRA